MACYKKHSFEYEMNMESFHYLDRYCPMTKPERDALRNWVKGGHDVDENPWGLKDSGQDPMSYLQAYRYRYGYSYGPWDYWKGPSPDTTSAWHIESRPAKKQYR